jgi:trans-L-3-hydroxyproline dehydratase
MEALTRWTAPAEWRRLKTIDLHTGGEPLRVVVDGVPAIAGRTMLERRRYVREHVDWVRAVLMREPRGHRDMYGCLVLAPERPGSHFGVLFMHNEGYSTMCGHGIIAVSRVAVETGAVPAAGDETTLRIDTPAGLVTSRVRTRGGKAVESVAFRNVPSFVIALDEDIEVAGLGVVRYDLAFGGAFYAYVDAAAFGLRCVPEERTRLIEIATAVKHAVQQRRAVRHPDDGELGFLYGTIFTADPRSSQAQSRNVCVFADGQIDRSPTGTGVSGRMALLHARGQIEAGSPYVIESIVDSRFTARIVETTMVGSIPAVVPEISGEAYVTGQCEFVIDPADPFNRGFLV